MTDREWRGAWMTHEDGFAYGEALGRATAIRALRKYAATQTPEQQRTLKELELSLFSVDVAEALAWLEDPGRPVDF